VDDDFRIERLSLHMGPHLGRYDRSGRQRCGIKAERLLLPRKILVYTIISKARLQCSMLVPSFSVRPLKQM